MAGQVCEKCGQVPKIFKRQGKKYSQCGCEGVTQIVEGQFEARDYQKPLIMALEGLEYVTSNGEIKLHNGKKIVKRVEPKKRAFVIWHRRAGKDLCMFNYLISRAMKDVGQYFYVFPTYSQGKKSLWENITNDGKRFLDYIPEELIGAPDKEKEKGKRENDMTIKLKNGSILTIVGSDNADRHRGTNAKGVVFSEYAFHKDGVWESVFSPAIRGSNGWAIFNTTPFGKNHAYDMFKVMEKNPKCFTQILTINDTGILTEDDIQEEREMGVDEDRIQREFYCSFISEGIGLIYMEQMRQAREENRICEVPVHQERPIYVATDLGVGDATALIFYQKEGESINIIHAYENTGKGLNHYVSYVNNYIQEKRSQLGKWYLPHDSKHRMMQKEDVKTIQQMLSEEIGSHLVKTIPIGGVEMGLEHTRRLFPRFKIHQESAKQLVSALNQYHKKYDDNRKMYSDKPEHDWSSHMCDALRYLSVSFEDIGEIRRKKEKRSRARKVRHSSIESRIREKFGLTT